MCIEKMCIKDMMMILYFYSMTYPIHYFKGRKSHEIRQYKLLHVSIETVESRLNTGLHDATTTAKRPTSRSDLFVFLNNQLCCTKVQKDLFLFVKINLREKTKISLLNVGCCTAAVASNNRPSFTKIRD